MGGVRGRGVKGRAKREEAVWVCGEHRGQGLVEGHAGRTANAQPWAYPRLVQRIRRALLELLKVPMQPGR